MRYVVVQGAAVEDDVEEEEMEFSDDEKVRWGALHGHTSEGMLALSAHNILTVQTCGYAPVKWILEDVCMCAA